MNTRNNKKLAYLFLAPTIVLLALFVGYPVLYNVVISFQDVSLNINEPSTFVGFENYVTVLTDPEFYKAIVTTIAYTALVVALSTAFGLLVAVLFSKEFRFKKTANALILASYVVPSIASIYIWQYMFNINYGIINYLLVDVLGVVSEAPLWFDEPILSFILVVLFAVWRYLPYAYISFYAILKTIDKSQYEAADIDGASGWEKFRYITLPGVMPVLITVVILRSVWSFYMYADIQLLTNQVNTLGIYMYENAFVFNDFGVAACMSIIMFIIIFPITKIIRKVENNE